MALELGNIASSSGGVGPEHVSQTDLYSAPTALFDGPITDKTMLYAREYMFRPLQQMETGGPFTFYIPGESGLYIDPETIRLEGELVILKKGDGGAWVDLTDDDEDVETDANGVTTQHGPGVCLVNSIGTSLFESVKVTLNGAHVNFIHTQNTHYKAYLETILTYGRDAAETHLRCNGFEMDQAGKFDVIKGNSGAEERATWTEKSGIVSFSSPIHNDILSVERFLPDMLALSITLTKTPDSFLLQKLKNHATEYKIQLQNLGIRMRKIQLPAALSTSIEASLAAGNRARYPLIRSEIKTYAIPQNTLSQKWNNIFLGQMPNTVCVGLVAEEAYQGKFDLNPFNFKPFKVADCHFTISGVSYPTEHYKFSKAKRHKAANRRTYRLMCDALGPGRANAGHQITEERYASGCRFYGYDFSPENCRAFHRHEHETGTFSVDFTFGEKLEQNVMCIIYATFNDEFQISQDRSLYTNIAATST